MTSPHVWSRINKKWIGLSGRKDAAVRDTPDYRGLFIWSYGNIAGAETTVQRAKDWVEALAEHEDIPPVDRWIGPARYLRETYGNSPR